MGSLALIFSPLLSAVTSVELATMKLHVPLKSQQIIPELIINGTSNRLDIFLVIFLSSFAKSMHTGFANMPSSFVDTLSESWHICPFNVSRKWAWRNCDKLLCFVSLCFVHRFFPVVLFDCVLVLIAGLAKLQLHIETRRLGAVHVCNAQ